MIGELLHEIRNYFDKSRHFGTFRIVDGSPIFDGIPIQTGQYFRICGSVHYGTTGPFSGESFAGYAYTRATGKNGGKYTEKDEFADQLKRWRKICPY